MRDTSIAVAKVMEAASENVLGSPNQE